MSQSQDIVISLREVSLYFKLRQGWLRPAKKYYALKDMTFDIYRGETLGVLGRNGAGKSTLLKLIAGILQPDEGQVINHGVSVSLLALGVGFDSELSGADNALLGGMFLGHRRRDVADRLDEIAAFAELGDFMHQPLKTYSSGMRSRLGFALAMSMSPDVLLLDEVLSVGDREFQKKAEAEMMRKIHSDQTVLFVSHDERQIDRICQRKIVID